VQVSTIEDHHGGDLVLISLRWWFMARVLQIGMISAAALSCDGQTAPNT